MKSPSSFDRTNQAQEFMSALGPDSPMREMLSLYGGHASHWDGQYLTLEATASARELARYFSKLCLDRKALKALASVPGIAESRMLDAIDADREGWAGMPARDWCREVSGETHTLRDRLQGARDELAKTGLKEALEESAIGMRRKRKRRLSEYAGEWDYDRRWDTTPFFDTIIQNREFPSLEVIFPIGMNASASAESIAQFNSRCLALCEVLEQAGYRISITGEIWGRRLTDGRPTEELVKQARKNHETDDIRLETYNVNHLGRFTVREADQYGDIGEFAALVSTEFFRRCLFALFFNPIHYVHAAPMAARDTCDSGYGQALDDRPVKANPGQLVLDKALIEKLFSTNKLDAQKMFEERVAHTVKQNGRAA